jgi:hypothetical protein
VDDFLVKKSMLAIAFNRGKEKEHEAPKEVAAPEFYTELKPPDPDSVKKYVLAHPDHEAAYRGLVSFLLPEESGLYRQRDVNDSKNLDLLSFALQRKRNLAAILKNENIPGNLTVIFNKLPPEILSRPYDELIPFLSPFEQKILSTASKDIPESDKHLNDFLVKQSLLAIAYNRSKQ